MSQFGRNQTLLHVKSEKLVLVQITPDMGLKIEATAEPAYAYIDLADENTPPTLWVRSAAEMEDGRFTTT